MTDAKGEKREAEAVRAYWLNCETCGVDILGESTTDHRCHGCGKIVCPTCVDVFTHFLGGEHGEGDPSERIEKWRDPTLVQVPKDELGALREVAHLAATDQGMGVSVRLREALAKLDALRAKGE